MRKALIIHAKAGNYSFEASGEFHFPGVFIGAVFHVCQNCTYFNLNLLFISFNLTAVKQPSL
jgi:hypothetical protein